MSVRCAIYTRKSTEEGLEQSFNSLDAQRDAAEAYIASQKAEGWIVLPDRYDDGGFTGGNTDRPAFQQLMQDVRDGKLDTIVVYKIDRLSRSLMDFAQIMETLEKHGASLVSVTQQFNTTSSMGRLTLNILLSFAQFEREIISERTRDKIGAMRRKGKYWGGHPVLGYDVERSVGGSRLVINPEEAARVRRLFQLYREHQAMMPVVAEAQRLGWANKVWTTKAGKVRGGGPIDKAILWRMLTNVTYTGKVAHKGETYDGEHEAIIDPELWQAVQAMLTRNSRSGGHGADCARRDDALLRGLLTCQTCGCAMMPTCTVKTTSDGAKKRYRYYTCHRANKQGKAKCPCPTLPAGEIERFVVAEIAGVGRDPDIRDRVLAEAGERLAEEGNGPALDHRAATAALVEFDHLWQALSPAEQRRFIQLLVERVAFDATHGRVSISFRPTGVATLGAPEPDDADQSEPELQEAAA